MAPKIDRHLEMAGALARWATTVADKLAEPDLDPERRAAIIAELDRVVRAWHQPEHPLLAVAGAMGEGAQLLERIRTDHPSVPEEGLRHMSVEQALTIIRVTLGVVDADAIDRDALWDAIQVWANDKPGKPSKYKALCRALRHTSFAPKNWESLKAQLRDSETGRDKPTGHVPKSERDF